MLHADPILTWEGLADDDDDDDNGLFQLTTLAGSGPTQSFETTGLLSVIDE